MELFCFRENDPHAVEHVEKAIIDEMIACGGIAPKELENGSLQFSAVEWELLCRGISARHLMGFLMAEIERRKKKLISEAVESNDGYILESVRDDIRDADIILKEGINELRKTLLYKVADFPTRTSLESALHQQAVDMLGDTAILHNLLIYP